MATHDMTANDSTPSPHGWFNPYDTATPQKHRQPSLDSLNVPMGPEPKNVMETLVMMEVVQQVQRLPRKQQEFVKVAQIKAYALNSLPPMYVTSEQGWARQWGRGQNELRDAIATSVRQGIAAVQRDPLREITQLSSESSPLAETALKQIMRLLGRDDLSWYTVVPALKQALGIRGHLPGQVGKLAANPPDRVGDAPSATTWDQNHRL
jgi:hypothetical protein